MSGAIDTHDSGHAKGSVRALALGAVGVVFGDIGTSPLYTMKEAFGEDYGLRATDHNVLGILSLVFWSLMLVVSLKYVTIIMRADNKGEGGIMSLMALVQRSLPVASETGYVVGVLGIFGAALFFGDGVITPAMTVLSAVEGLKVAEPHLADYVVPVTVALIIGLFMLQRRGTERVGKLFAPVMVTWFVVLAALGIAAIAKQPTVIQALNPYWGLHFFAAHGWHSVLVLGAVVLAVTGGEALYADMGHFGKVPIRAAWWYVVLPALVLNYFGQGALLLDHPSAAENPFYRLAPGWALGPLIGLATVAAIIASQAVISGAFSVARQAIQLGYLPRLVTKHTSDTTIGQVYLPWINRMLMLIVIALVIGFGSSDKLASAYGVSVTGTMLIDTLLLVVLMRSRWLVAARWVFLFAIVFLVIDTAFLVANGAKFFEGAWFPLALGVVVFTLMRTWRRGRQLLVEEVRREMLTLDTFLRSLEAQPPVRVSGTAVFMTATNDKVPLALLHNLKHNKVLHARNILLTVETVPSPRADAAEQIVVTDLGRGFWRLGLRYGFMEDPDVPRSLAQAGDHGLPFDLEDTTFFASRETLVASAHKGMPLWRDRLFAVMAQNTVSATTFFKIPGNRLVELGTQVEI
jgi:KUP system potassium uptake protein